MSRLPLFPLPVVLYPRAVMPLHIFEPRYRRLVARCLEFDRRFGLVFHDPDRSGPFLYEAGRVGCVAEIERMQMLDDGRSLILTRGRERFRIDDGIESEEPYYEALVDPFVDEVPDEEALLAQRVSSLALFHSVLSSLPEPPDPLPSFDIREELSFRLAATVDTDPAWHQSMLESRDELERLARVDRIFEAARDSADGAGQEA